MPIINSMMILFHQQEETCLCYCVIMIQLGDVGQYQYPSEFYISKTRDSIYPNPMTVAVSQYPSNLYGCCCGTARIYMILLLSGVGTHPGSVFCCCGSMPPQVQCLCLCSSLRPNTMFHVVV